MKTFYLAGSEVRGEMGLRATMRTALALVQFFPAHPNHTAQMEAIVEKHIARFSARS